MANIGAFDSDQRPLAWFAPVAVAGQGWFDGLSFSHDLITSGEITGDAGITETPSTLAAAGAVDVASTGSITESADVVAATGAIGVAGAADITEAADTVLANDAGVTGTATITEQPDFLEEPIGEVPDTLTGAGGVAVAGDAPITLAPDPLTAAGAVALAVQAAVTLAPDTATGAGQVAVTGTAQPIEEGADTLAAAATTGLAGQAAITVSPDALTAAGTVVVPAQGDVTLAPDATTAAGQVAIATAAAIAEAADTLVSEGAVTTGYTGQAPITLAPDILTSAGTVALAAQAAITEAAAVLTASVYGPVQSAIKAVKAVNSTTLAFPQPLSVGSMIHVAVVTFQSVAGTTITTPTDTLGNVYQPTAAQQNISSNTVHMRDWYVPGCAPGACTITLDISGAGTGEITVCASEWRGRDLVSPLSGTPSTPASTATNAPSTGNMTPSHDGCLLIAVLNAGGGPITITEEAGWSVLEEYDGSASSVTLSVVWKLQTFAASDGSTWTLSSSPFCLARLSAYRPAGIPVITGVGAIVLAPDTTTGAQTSERGSRLLLMDYGA